MYFFTHLKIIFLSSPECLSAQQCWGGVRMEALTLLLVSILFICLLFYLLISCLDFDKTYKQAGKIAPCGQKQIKLNCKAWFKKRFTLNWANLNQNYVEHFFVAIFDLVFAEQKKKNWTLSLV